MENKSALRSSGAKKTISVVGRILFPLAVFFAWEPPTTSLLGFSVLALAVFAAIFGNWRSGRAIALAFGCVILAGLAGRALPELSIEEGHQVFVSLDPNSVGEGMRAAFKSSPYHQLPEEVFSAVHSKFLAEYPSARGEGEQGQWKWHGFPERLYAYSEDGWWSQPAMSRTVSGIKFEGVEELRPGFLSNERFDYYHWMSDVTRERIPYFVEYRWPSGIAGSWLTFSGWAFVEEEDGKWRSLEALSAPAQLQLTAGDEGKRFFLWRIDPEVRIAADLEPPALFQWAARVRVGLLVLASVLSTFVAMSLGDRKTLRAATLLLLGAASANLWLSGSLGEKWLATGLAFSLLVVPWLQAPKASPNLRRVGRVLTVGLLAATVAWTIPPELDELRVLAGGMDGLRHEGFGHDISGDLFRGDFLGALEGFEPVFYFMPGLRYFQALEDILFGATKFGDYLLLALLPLLWWTLARRLMPKAWAWVLVGIFLLSTGHLSFAWNVKQMWMDYAEPLGALFFVGALIPWVDCLHEPDASRRRQFSRLFLAYLLVSLAVACRPNFVVAAMILGLVGLFVTWKRDNLWQAMVPGLGFFPIFLMPLHNLAWGGEWVLFADQATHSYTLFTSPLDYWRALGEWLSGQPGPAWEQVLGHWQRGFGQVWQPGIFRVGTDRVVEATSVLPPLQEFLGSLLQVGKIGALLLALGVGLSCRRWGVPGYLGLLVLGLHGVLLFYNNVERFSLFAWELTFLFLASLGAVVGRGIVSRLKQEGYASQADKFLQRIPPALLVFLIALLLVPAMPWPKIVLQWQEMPPEETVAKVYWDTGSGFNEGDAAELQVRDFGGPTSYRLPISSVAPTALRLDPGAVPGNYRIKEVQWNAWGRAPVPLGIEKADLIGLTGMESREDGSISVEAANMDPQLVWLDLPGPTLAAKSVRMAWPLLLFLGAVGMVVWLDRRGWIASLGESL